MGTRSFRLGWAVAGLLAASALVGCSLALPTAGPPTLFQVAHPPKLGPPIAVSPDDGPSFVAIIEESPARGAAPLRVSFEAVVTGASGSLIEVGWAFSDGGSDSGLAVDHTFSSAGSFDVNLSVEDDAQDWAYSSAVVSVSAATPSLPGALPTLAWGLLAAAGSLASAATVYSALVGRRQGISPAEPEVPSGARTEFPSARRGRASAARRLPPPEAQESIERVLLHLYWNDRSEPDGLGRVELTREGVAVGARLSPSAAGRTLRRLVEAGAVAGRSEHVPGAPRRVRCYRLTSSGVAAARAVDRSGPVGATPAAPRGGASQKRDSTPSS